MMRWLLHIKCYAALSLGGTLWTAIAFAQGPAANPIVVLPVDGVPLATSADVALELRVVRPIDPQSGVRCEIVVRNIGTYPFSVPDNFALPPGRLRVEWQTKVGASGSRNIQLGTGVRCGSNNPQSYVRLQPGAYFGRSITVTYEDQSRTRAPSVSWPVGTYTFRVYMEWAASYAADGVPRGAFESAPVEVTIE